MCFSLISSTRYLSPCLNSAYIGPLSALFSGIVPLYDAMSSRYTCHQTLKTFCEPLASPLTGQWYLIEGHWCLLTCCLGGGGGGGGGWGHCARVGHHCSFQDVVPCRP